MAFLEKWYMEGMSAIHVIRYKTTDLYFQFSPVSLHLDAILAPQFARYGAVIRPASSFAKSPRLVHEPDVCHAMTSEGQANQQQMFPKTHAKELFCLSEKDLQPLPAKEKRNPYVRKGTPMKLYKQEDLEEVAVQKWGSLEDVEQEKERRVAKKEKRALEKAEQNQDEEAGSGPEDSAAANGSSDQGERPAATDEQGNLHPLILERVQKLSKGAANPDSRRGAFVLYWMRTALRDHDNPALDVACAEAAARELPLLCMSFLLGAAHTHPTHRRFKFMLEGFRDLQMSFNSKGIPYFVYVEGVSQHLDSGITSGWGAVLAVAKQADLIVTEIMPTPPYAQNLQDLVDRDLPAAVWAVDTACVVPVTLTKKPYAKAYAYRSGTAAWRSERLKNLPYTSSPVQGPPSGTRSAHEVPGLPWTSVDLVGEEDLSGLLERSDAFDSSVPGVKHMIGGQSAGYARWEAFRKSGLSQYAARRNNPMLRSGVSRLSAYHHFGMVSPFRIAREASNAASSGARKFADEFMTWREISYCFCFHNWRILETLQVLPPWAQKTLTAHTGDPRELKSLEQLEQGTTGDKIWDALQHQLNRTGELHNNVRMTWGKAVIQWTPDPESALQQTCHLNHKYALDGCDPASYGGILWCFGQFDGPKGSENTPIMGSLRNRPTQWLTRKLDPARFRELPLETASSMLDASTGLPQSTPQRDIRSCFARATEQPELTGKAAEAKKDSKDLELPLAALQESASKEAGSTKRKPEKDQPGIKKFFKRAK